jgi:hypothetical protein
MRIRITFLTGFAVGFIAGARAGRERYNQIVILSRKVAENPTVQQATRTAGAKATELSKAAGQKAAERMPKVAETAKSGASKAKTGATKVRGQLDRLPGRSSGNDDPDPDPATVNGTRPVDLA